MDKHIDAITIKSFSINSIRSSLIIKLKTSSRQKATIEYKVATGSDGNSMYINTYKILFPKETLEQRVLFVALGKSDRQLQDSIAWWKLTHIQFVRQKYRVSIGKSEKIGCAFPYFWNFF